MPRNADSLRHPASLTKIMTLYLLSRAARSRKAAPRFTHGGFEHAAQQAPSKLGLELPVRIRLQSRERRIRACTKDEAGVVMRRSGGDEDTFARLMTARQRSDSA